MSNHVLNLKKFQKNLACLVQATTLQNNGVSCYFERASEAISFGAFRSEVLDALKKDVSDTAEDLFKAKGIIASIKNGLVLEVDSLNNTVEEVFGVCYNAQKQTITLSGVEFAIGVEDSRQKSDFVAEIFQNIFDVNAKELNEALKAVKKYEEEKDAVNQALLYPATLKADEIISKVVGYDLAFSEFRNALSYEEKVEYDLFFLRTGITGVIQNASYVDGSGIKQITKGHSALGDLSEISTLLRNGELKFVDSVEIDGDADPKKALRVIEQIERLKLNTSKKGTLKFRKLGNYKTRGIYVPSANIVAFDVRTMSAVLHEWAHKIEADMRASGRQEEVKFLDYIIDIMKSKISLPPELESKSKYFYSPTEILARACEIAALLMVEEGKLLKGTDEFDLIKSRDFYKELEGVYFNFTELNGEEKALLKKLFQLFFNTSPGETFDSGIDNFTKINTCFRKKEKSFYEAEKEEERKVEKERKALYSMVTAENIELIFANRGEVGIVDLSSAILANVRYLGGNDSRGTAEYWAGVSVDKAIVLNYVFEQLKRYFSEDEYVKYLSSLKGVFGKIRTYVLCDGFKPGFAYSVKQKIAENEKKEIWDSLKSFIRLVSISPFFILSPEKLNDIEVVKEYLNYNVLREMDKNLDITVDTLRAAWEYLYANQKITELPSRLNGFEDAALLFLGNNPTWTHSVSRELLNNASFMKKALALGSSFGACSKELLDDEEFVRPYVEANENNLKYVSTRLQKLLKPQYNEPKPTTRKQKTTTSKKDVDVEVEKVDFEQLVKEASVEEAKHTQTGETLKVLKLKRFLPKELFSEFNKFLIANDIAYYSKLAKGFVVKNIEKITAIAAASTTVAISADLLEAYANGRLF